MTGGRSPSDAASIDAAWRGGELLTRSEWPQRLDPDELRELAEPIDLTVEGSPLGARLARIQHELEHGPGAFLIKGLPVEDRDEASCRRMFEAIVSAVGTPISQSAAGERIFSVRDEGLVVGQPRARGPNTSKRLSFHTDRCDVIAFLCLRQARSGGENQIASSVAVYRTMLERRPDLVEVLREPFYLARHNVDLGNAKPWCRQPIFSFCEGRFACSFLRVLIDRAYALEDLPDLTDRQREALDLIEAIAAEDGMHLTFRQEPGDLLLLNNWVILHRREAFTDHDDPARRRHILRAWLSVPNSRPIDPLFADNFGATAAGAIRGGMRQAAP